MALSVTDHDSAVDYKIVHESSLNATPDNNVTSGPGTLHSIFINNNNDQYIYIKIVDGYSASAGSTNPTWIFPCAASSVLNFEIPGGQSFSALSIWCTTGASPADSTAPSLGVGESVKVYLVTS
tara:strand:+ start:1855 stop:2226 length:372 start_codon:yes stop_codon:yes gene_type:complete